MGESNESCASVVPSQRMVSRSSIDFLSVSSASLRRCPLPPAVTGRMGFNKDLSRHPPTMTALQPPSQTSTVELKAPPPTSPRSPSTDIWLDTNYRGHLRPSFSFSTFCAFLFSIFFFVCGFCARVFQRSSRGPLGCSWYDMPKKKLGEYPAYTWTLTQRGEGQPVI